MGTAAKRLTRAESRERTRDELIAAAERCFLERGYHETSVDQIAEEAGYTKGAVYGNFASKDDVFLAVYARRVERGIAQARRAFAEEGPIGGFERLTAERGHRRGRDERWLAVFLEFWAHVIRNPDERERFAELHTRALEPFVEATERMVAEHGAELPVDPASFNTAMNVMQLGIALESLTRPALVERDLGVRMTRFVIEKVTRGRSRGRRSK